MSIVRVGLSQTKKYGEGYEAIFGKKTGQSKPATAAMKKTGAKKAKTGAKKAKTGAKKTAAKKSTAKKK